MVTWQDLLRNGVEREVAKVETAHWSQGDLKLEPMVLPLEERVRGAGELKIAPAKDTTGEAAAHRTQTSSCPSRLMFRSEETGGRHTKR